MPRLTLELPGDVEDKLIVFEQCWQRSRREVITQLLWLHRHPVLWSCRDPSSATVTWLVRHSKIRQFPCADEKTTHTEVDDAHPTAQNL